MVYCMLGSTNSIYDRNSKTDYKYCYDYYPGRRVSKAEIHLSPLLMVSAQERKNLRDDAKSESESAYNN